MNPLLPALCITALALPPCAAAAQEQAPAWLFVQTASGFTSDGTTLRVPYEREIFAFTDRPNRLHAYLNAHEFVSLWEAGDDDFAQNPPNAVLTWVAEGGLREAELEITAASVGDLGRSIVYTIVPEAGDEVPAKAGQFSLFVDNSNKMGYLTQNYVRNNLGQIYPGCEPGSDDFYGCAREQGTQKAQAKEDKENRIRDALGGLPLGVGPALAPPQ